MVSSRSPSALKIEARFEARYLKRGSFNRLVLNHLATVVVLMRDANRTDHMLGWELSEWKGGKGSASVLYCCRLV